MGINTKDIENRHKMRQKTKQKRFTLVVSFLFFIILVLTVMLASLLTPLFNVRKVVVKGNNLVEAQDVINSLGTDENSKVFTIDKKLMKKRVETLPFVKNAKIQRRIWGSVIVEIEESKVSGYIMSGKNAVLFDEMGKIVNVMGEEPEGFTEITGCSLASENVGEKINVGSNEKANVILMFTKAFDDAGITDKMSNVNMEDILNVTGIYDNRYDIIFGDSASIDSKIAIMTKAIGHNAENEMGTVDLRILGNAYIKPERTFVKNVLSGVDEEKEEASGEENGENEPDGENEAEEETSEETRQDTREQLEENNSEDTSGEENGENETSEE